MLPGDKRTYVVDASSCSTFLTVELWDDARVDGSVVDEADPMLAIRHGANPTATYNEADAKWTWSDYTTVDTESFQLWRPYHRATIDMRACATRCASACASSSAANCATTCAVGCVEPPPGNDFRVLLYNVEYYSRNELEFELTARCSASAPCPRPKGAAAGDCSGEGACGAATQADGVAVDHLATTGVCACDAGFGDFGCDKTLRRLEDGVSVSVQLGSGEWSYFDFEVTAPAAYGADPSIAMLVDLRRAAGDPVLFVKRVDAVAAGTTRGGGVPSRDDYDAFADSDGSSSRLNYHHRLLTAEPGRFYVAVYNADTFLRQAATFTLTARTSLPSMPGVDSGTPLCPAQCNGRGACIGPDRVGVVPIGTCRCEVGYAGEFCEGTRVATTLGQTETGALAPGEWAYVVVDLTDAVASAGVLIHFEWNGLGHPGLLFKAGNCEGGADSGGCPSLLDGDAVALSTTQHVATRKSYRISPDQLNGGGGKYTVGLYNFNYYKDDVLEYAIRIEMDDSNAYVMVSPGFMTVVLVIIMSMFLCMLLSVCRRFMMRRPGRRPRTFREFLAGRPAQEDWGDFPMGENGGDGRPRRPPGCPRRVIDAIPTSTFDAARWESGVGAKQDASCSVCIEAFENGELLRTLPTCEHSFHKACIDEWLTAHTTCPNCRHSLVDEPEEEEDARNGARARNGGAELAGRRGAAPVREAFHAAAPAGAAVGAFRDEDVEAGAGGWGAGAGAAIAPRGIGQVDDGSDTEDSEATQVTDADAPQAPAVLTPVGSRRAGAAP